MRILIFSLDPKMADPESGARVRHREYATLVEEMVIIVLAPTPKRGTWQDGRLTIHAHGSRGGPKLWYWFTGIIWGIRSGRKEGRRLAREGDTLATSPEPFGVGLITYLVAHSLRIPLQLQIHTDIFAHEFAASLKNKLFLILARFMLPRAQGIRVVSQKIKEGLQAAHCKLQAEPVVLPVFVDAQMWQHAKPTFQLLERFSRLNPAILWVGRLTPEKNPALAIETLAELKKTHPDAGLIMVGHGPECETLALLVARLNMKESVVFAGWQSDLVPYYKGAHALLVTSHFEGYGMQMIEAALCSLPIVATDVGVAREVGGHIAAGNPTALARALGPLLAQEREDGEGHADKSARAHPELVLDKKTYHTRLLATWQACLESKKAAK